MSPDRQTRWLRAGAALVIASGLIVVLGAHPATSGLAVLAADLLFWPRDKGQSLAAPETRLLAAIGGGVMLGWGLMLWQLAGPLLTLAPAATRRVILTSIAAWFLADSLASLAAGAWSNLLGNTVFLILFVYPLRQNPG